MRVLRLWWMLAHLRVSPSFMVLEMAREKCPFIPVMSRLGSWRKVRKRLGWGIRNQSGTKLFALLMMRLCGLLRLVEAWAKTGMVFSCLKKKPLSMLMRRRNMWMSLEAGPQCIVVWSLRGSVSESLWAVLSCKTKAGFLIPLVLLFVSY